MGIMKGKFRSKTPRKRNSRFVVLTPPKAAPFFRRRHFALRRRPLIGGLERGVLVLARSLRRASAAPHGRGTRPVQPDDRARGVSVLAGW